jgi:hypothetical protein
MIRPLANSFPLLCTLCLCAGCGWISDPSEACTSSRPRRVRIEVDWSQFEEEVPEGMSVILYTDGSNEPTILSTNEVTHVETLLEEGTYHVAVINYSPEEFTNLRFAEMHSMASALLTTYAVTDPWYKPGRAYEGVNEQPETFGYDADTYLEVYEELFDSVEVVRLTELTPLVVTPRVEVVIHARGLQYITSLRGALSGMAAGYYPSLGRPTQVSTTFLMEDWNLTRSTWNRDAGTLTTTLTTFGRPYGFTSAPEEQYLTLEATRTDGQRFTMDIPVGDRFERISRTHLRIEVGDSLIVEAPASQLPGTSGSGFEADVSDWGEAEDWNFEF